MANLEAILQSKIVIKFSQLYPERRGCLIGYFANADNQIKGAINNSLGLVKNCSDLLYVTLSGSLVGIELKSTGSRHNRTHLIGQATWLITVPKIGYFCDSEEMFFSIINGGVGISPAKVLENCLRLKTQTVNWEEAKK